MENKLNTAVFAVLYGLTILMISFVIAEESNAQTSATQVGGTTFINSPGRPTVICTRIGTTFFCN